MRKVNSTKVRYYGFPSPMLRQNLRIGATSWGLLGAHNETTQPQFRRNYASSKYGQKTCQNLVMHLRVLFCLVEICTLNNKLLEERTRRIWCIAQLYILWEALWSDICSRCVIFHKWHSVHATNMCYNKRCSPHLGIVAIISIIGSAKRSAHTEFHFHNSWINLDSMKT